MEYIVYCSGISLCTCSALYQWNILFTVQEYSCLHVQHYTDGISCLLFRNIPVYMFSTIPMETSEYLDPVRAEILKRADMRSDNFGEQRSFIKNLKLNTIKDIF